MSHPALEMGQVAEGGQLRAQRAAKEPLPGASGECGRRRAGGGRCPDMEGQASRSTRHCKVRSMLPCSLDAVPTVLGSPSEDVSVHPGLY